MTGADDGDGSDDAVGSRFDEFLDRLDERRAGRKRSGPKTESDDSASARNEGPSAGGDADPELDPDGWLWGPSEGLDAASEGDDPPDGDADRLWNAGVEPLGEDATAVGSPSPRSDTERDSFSDESGGTAGPAERDRWAGLGSNLGTDAGPRGGRRTQGDDRVESDAHVDGSERATPQVDDAGTPSRDDRKGVDVAEPDRTRTQPASMSTVDAGRSTSVDRVTSASSVLVLGPTEGSVSDAVCSRFLTGEEGSRDVIFVTFQESPEDRVDVCRLADGWEGGEIGIIEVGRGSRNAPAASEITGDGSVGSITVRHVSKPGDLSKLGIVITQLLSEFEDTPRRTVLCFHTLSALHNQVGTKTLFRFLNTLAGRLRSADALGHYHMDPDLHDEIVVETLRPIFDSVVRYSADGKLEID